MQEKGENIKLSKDGLLKMFKTKDLFKAFVFMHMIIANRNLFPTFLISYADGTIILKSFQSTIKTTTYRLINEISNKIINEKINNVMFMTIYTFVPFSFENLFKISNERINNNTNEMLVFMSCDSDLNERECSFANYFSLNPEEIVDNFLHNLKNSLDIGKNNFKPIVEAFLKIKNNNIS